MKRKKKWVYTIEGIRRERNVVDLVDRLLVYLIGYPLLILVLIKGILGTLLVVCLVIWLVLYPLWHLLSNG